MTEKRIAVLDIENDADELTMDLQFKDFGTEDTSQDGHNEQTIHFSNFPDSAEDEQELKLLDEDGDLEGSPRKPAHSFWTFDFYQQLFDVDSKQVGDRIVWSMVPKPGTNYLQTYIRPNPDLYGPFWICLTLVFTTAISGNLSNYFNSKREHGDVWRYDFHKVTFAASAIFAYAWLIPVAIWGVLAWRSSRSNISLLELLCVYGYSLAIFVPVSILWVIPQPWLQFCIAIVAPVLSGTVLVRTVWPALAHDTKRVAIAIAVIILVLHATLALGFMLYFFTPPRQSDNYVDGFGNNTVLVTAAAAAAGDINVTERNENINKPKVGNLVSNKPLSKNDNENIPGKGKRTNIESSVNKEIPDKLIDDIPKISKNESSKVRENIPDDAPNGSSKTDNNSDAVKSKDLPEGKISKDQPEGKISKDQPGREESSKQES